MCIILFPIQVQAQDADVDSLKQVARQLPLDTSRVNRYNDIARATIRSQPDTAISYATQALTLAQKINYPQGALQAALNQGDVHRRLSQFDDALTAYLEVLDYCQQVNDSIKLAYTYNQIGIVHAIQGNYRATSEWFNKTLAINKALHDEEGIGKVLNNLGNVHISMGDYDEALKYLLEALAIRQKIGDENGQATTLNNLGLIYSKQKSYDEALEHYRQSLELNEKSNNIERGINILNNIANIYEEIDRTDEAIAQYDKALDLSRKIGDLYLEAKTVGNKGVLYHTLGDLTKARALAMQALAIRAKIDDWHGSAISYNNLGVLDVDEKKWLDAKQHFLKSIEYAEPIFAAEVLQDNYQRLSEVLEQLGDHKNAYRYFDKYMAVKDSVFSEESTKNLNELQAKYETEKNAREIAKGKEEAALKNLQLSKERTQNRLLGGGLIALLLIGLLLHNRYRQQQKRRLTEQQLKQQELRLKAMLEGEQQERKRLAQSLQHGLGNMLDQVKQRVAQFRPVIATWEPQKEGQFNNALKLIDNSQAELGNISQNMMPAGLVEHGLVAALEHHLEKVPAGTLSIQLDAAQFQSRFSGQLELTLFRVIQEVLNNILKHAKARQIKISLIYTRHQIQVTIKDDGVGFDVKKTKQNGIGLQNIRSRIELLGGSVQYDSKLDHGTTVTIKVPAKAIIQTPMYAS